MAVITQTTSIKAPKTLCFDLARSIDLHQDTFQHTREKAVAGVRTGLIDFGQQVTWKAIHFGFPFRLTSKITLSESPERFIDQMVSGPFSYFYHEHRFSGHGKDTIMIDRIVYRSPLGLLGRVVDRLFMKRYLTKLMALRNRLIKETAESPSYEKYLPPMKTGNAKVQEGLESAF